MTTISIIIPTLNRAGTLHITLASIGNQTNLLGAELIVIDNGSTDNTAEVYNSFALGNKLPSQYHYDAEPGLLTGRHLGASLAMGNILCFLDDDVELDTLWLESVREAFSNTEVQLATGPCIPKYVDNPPAWLQYFWITRKGKFCYWLSLMDFGDKLQTIHPNYVWGLNFCIRKDALLALGGFHPDCIPDHLQMYQGDGETGLTIKALELKYKCLYHPGIKLLHIIAPARLTVDYFKKRAFYQGVCNSFSALKGDTSNNKSELTVRLVLKKILQLLRKPIALYRKATTPAEIRALRNTLEQEEKNGYDYHQQAFKSNEKVREWVNKKDYWNYKLPL